MKKNPSSILQDLESDDELPDTYNDVSILPAYLDDARFDEIKFPWVNNANLIWEEPTFRKHVNQIQREDVILRREGVLNGQDLYCLKSLESCSCSTTLVWFINFLLHKDLQSHYNYLKSCLVNDIISTNLITGHNYSHSNDIVNDRYEIVIKV